jgi:GNAT superfamily N-acetyltransferase
MNSLLLLPFNLSMLQECINLYQQVFSKEPWFEQNSYSDVERYFLTFLENNKFVGYVIKNNEKIIAVSLGFLKPWIKGEEYYIDQFYVDYDLQGKGIGTFFINEIKKGLVKKGIHAMILATEKEFPAFDFYRKNGFFSLEELCFLGAEF